MQAKDAFSETPFQDAVVLYEWHEGRPAVTVLPLDEGAPNGLAAAAARSYQVSLTKVRMLFRTAVTTLLIRFE